MKAPTPSTDDSTDTEHTTLADITIGDTLYARDIHCPNRSKTYDATPRTTPGEIRGNIRTDYDGGIYTVWRVDKHNRVVLYCPDTELYAVAKKWGREFEIESIGEDIKGHVDVELGEDASPDDVYWLEDEMMGEMVWGNYAFAYISPNTPRYSIDFVDYYGFDEVDGPIEIYPVATDDYDRHDRLAELADE